MSKRNISTIDLAILAKVNGGNNSKTKTTVTLGSKKLGGNVEHESDSTTTNRNDCIDANRKTVCPTKGFFFNGGAKDPSACVKNLNALCGEPPKSGD